MQSPVRDAFNSPMAPAQRPAAPPAPASPSELQQIFERLARANPPARAA